MSLIYAVVASGWKLLSDRVLSAHLDLPLSVTRYQTEKGLVFVLVTSVLLYFLLRDLLRRSEKDAAKRREAEEATIRLAAIVESSGDAIVGMDFNSIVTSWNAGAEKVFGFSTGEMVGQPILRLIPSDSLHQEAEALARIRRGEVVNRYESSWLHKDGRSIDVSVMASPIRDTEGRIVAVSKLARDITRRNTALQALRESEARYRSLFDNMVEGFAYCRMLFEDGRPADFIYLEVNDAFQTLTGLKGVIGRKASEVIPGIRESDPELLERYGRVAMTGRSEQFETYVAAMQMWFSISVYCPAKEHFVCVFDVITGRKRMEERLELQSDALEAAANAIVITNSKGVIEWANAAFTTYTGYSLAEAVGHTPSLLKSGQHTGEFYQDMWNKISTGNVWQGEMINRRKDGSLYTEEMTITPIRDSLGEIRHFIAVKQDITGRKKLEAQFLRVQRMESIGTLAGGIAHDLNNVLAPILMAVEILGDKITDDAGRELLATLESSAQHGADLVRQVLAFARGIEGQRIVVDPVHLLKDIKKMVRDTFPKNIEFSLTPAPDQWTVVGDPTQLHQVFTNLCVNARDAMPHGGSLRITMENVELDDTYAATSPDAIPGTYLMVKVTDTGTGMPPKVMERIFEPFFTTKEPGTGTGLGLSTTMAIVKSHGGFVTVNSEMGKGTTFSVYLPASATSMAHGTSATREGELPRGNGELVLVVDDEENIRAIAKKTLERFGYRVLLASNGAEAVSVYSQSYEEIAIVLTDMSMPVMDGASTLATLKAINPRVKVIASSGLAVSRANAQALEEGSAHFIQKPYTAQTLLGVMATALREQS